MGWNMLDLAGFHSAEADQALSQINVVLEIELDKIVEDTDQPRQEFDEEHLNALAVDIKLRGVQTPIAVHPAADGVYKIIHGACRYRASKLAGLKTIPLIVQSDQQRYDDYSQMAENTKRAELHPMDIARFIQKRKELGESNKEIAEKLGERPDYIVFHLALLSAPGQIIQAFQQGRIRGAQSVWSMSKLYEKSPAAVDLLLATPGEITRKMIREASADPVSQELVAGTADKNITAENVPPLNVLADEQPAVTESPVGDSQSPSVLPVSVVTESKSVKKTNVDRKPLKSADSPLHANTASKLEKPVVYGVYEGRPVEVCIFRKPTDHGLVWIKWEDVKAPEEEVLADKVSLSRVEEK